MVARIISGKSIRGMLHYNENKVDRLEARLIMASGFAADVSSMSLEKKLLRFTYLTILNPKVKTNAVHISLNFDRLDKLSNEQMVQISKAYMERIGFGDQPYLVYRHTDAAHPHIHIATTNIKADGQRIDLHGIGWMRSEPARKELEKEYGLVVAERRQRSNELGIKPADIGKAEYGKVPTKHAITNIVNAVIRDYKFTSLAEFNAVLKQFNIVADRGREDTQMFQKNGLLYSLIDGKGEKIGVPIKASALYGKPTLVNLSKLFERNIDMRKPFRDDLKQRIERTFKAYQSISKATWIAEMVKQQVQVTFRQNDQGFIYGVTYVDHQNRTVFNGSELGKAYSAKAITERFSATDKPIMLGQKTYLQPLKETQYLKSDLPEKNHLQPGSSNPLSLGLLAKNWQDNTGYGTPKKKKRKKQTEQSMETPRQNV
jgi:hypothetical protein